MSPLVNPQPAECGGFAPCHASCRAARGTASDRTQQWKHGRKRAARCDPTCRSGQQTNRAAACRRNARGFRWRNACSFRPRDTHREAVRTKWVGFSRRVAPRPQPARPWRPARGRRSAVWRRRRRRRWRHPGQRHQSSGRTAAERGRKKLKAKDGKTDASSFFPSRTTQASSVFPSRKKERTRPHTWRQRRWARGRRPRRARA